jgi:hypothetical protein
MTPHDSHLFDDELAGHLRRAAGSEGAARRLSERLAWTTIPPQANELRGEHRAVAAFRAAAALTPDVQARRPSMIKTTVAKLLTLKAAAIIAAASIGGVALAATTGTLPNPLSQDPPNPAHGPTAPAADPGNPGQGSPSPSLEGLCNAYLAGAGSEHGKALENPAFQALVTAAGGADSVDSFCATLDVTPPNGNGPDHPTGPPATHKDGSDTDPGSQRSMPRSTDEPTPAVTHAPNGR